jgi:hypothetical protein
MPFADHLRTKRVLTVRRDVQVRLRVLIISRVQSVKAV